MNEYHRLKLNISNGCPLSTHGVIVDRLFVDIQIQADIESNQPVLTRLGPLFRSVNVEFRIDRFGGSKTIGAKKAYKLPIIPSHIGSCLTENFLSETFG